MRLVKRLLVVSILVAGVAGCGGGKQSSSSTTDEVTGGGGDDSGNPCGDEPAMASPEVLDHIQATLNRRRALAARCLTDAINAGTAPRNAKGSLALSFVIGTSGKPRDVKVIRSSLQNEDVERCVVAKVEEIDFGEIPVDLDWSHTYAFESM